MKKHVRILFLTACSSALLGGCKNKESGEEKQVELNVFAAASMTETLNTIKTQYEAKNSKVKINLNLESSGTLKKQIANGADCDIFISAAQKQMNELETENLVDKTTRFNLLENKVVLATSSNNPKNVTSFANLASRLGSEEGFILGMGNSDVPVGQYTQKILEYYELNEATLAAAGKINYGTNVKAVTTAVSSNAVACGVIYQTDAFSANLNIVDTATEAMCGQVLYPAAVMKNAKQETEAAKFLLYLTTPAAMTVFESVGFVRAAK